MQNSIPKNWQVIKATDLCARVTDGTHDTPMRLSVSKHPLITSKQLKDGKINSTDYFISEDDFEEINKRSKVDQWDVLFGMIGTVGDTVIVKEENPQFAIKNIGLFKTGKNKALAQWLIYYFKSPKGNSYLKSVIRGTSQGYIPLESLREFPILIPKEKNYLRKVMAVLSTFDDKIELNNKISKTLEEMAHAIFKEWFVEFEFPIPLLRGTVAAGGWKINANSLFPYWNLPKNQKLRERAKELRKQGILSEVVFWKKFKDKKTLGWDIDRQVIIDNFIVDFFIPELGLVFEIDGASHDDKQEYDLEREVVLKELGLEVVRVSDRDVLKNIDGVWEFVNMAIKDRVKELSTPPFGHPSRGEESTPSGFACHPSRGELGYKSSGGKMIDSELGKIPEGWEIGNLADILELAYGKALKENQRKEGNVLVIGSSGIVGTHNEKLVSGPGIVVGRKGNVGSILWVDDDFYPIDTTYYVKSKKGLHYCYCLLKKQMFISGDSAVPGLNRDVALRNTIIVPKDEIIEKFENVAIPIFLKLAKIKKENKKLAALRDLLLPKLMKGEIRI